MMENGNKNELVFYNKEYYLGDDCFFGDDVHIGNPHSDCSETSISIGSHCVFEEGVVIDGNNIIIKDNVHIGKNCFIKGENIVIGENSLIYDQVLIATTKQLELGNRCKISRNCAFRCYSIYIGNDLWCNENVDIGGGGCWQESAELEIGDFVHIGKNAMINVCQPTHIGSRTGIGIESMIFTHSAGNGQSVLEGYSHIEKGVWIGDHVSLFTRAFITPGCKIDSGVIVGASAYASGYLEKGLYVGIPAKKKREIPVLGYENKVEIMQQMLIQHFEKSVSLYLDNALLNSQYRDCILLLTEEDDKKNHRLIQSISKSHENAVVISILPLNKNSAANLTTIRLVENDISGITSILSESVRDLLRRNGILPDFIDYTPFPLNYDELKRKGIER